MLPTLVAVRQSMLPLPENVHLFFYIRVVDCPYDGLGATPGNWFLVTTGSTANAIRPGTLLHEFGHNLGLSHTHGYDRGGLLSFTKTPGAVLGDVAEYGDRTDVMGASAYPTQYGAGSLAMLGWAGDEGDFTCGLG